MRYEFSPLALGRQSKVAGFGSVDDHFDQMKMKELQAYLKSHGQLLSGRKNELIRRAKGTFQLSLRKAAQTALCNDRPENESAETERSALTENHIVERLADWTKVDDVSSDNWPDFTDKEVYNYLVHSCKRTIDFKRKGARRQLKAHTFYSGEILQRKNGVNRAARKEKTKPKQNKIK